MPKLIFWRGKKTTTKMIRSNKQLKFSHASLEKITRNEKNDENHDAQPHTFNTNGNDGNLLNEKRKAFQF